MNKQEHTIEAIKRNFTDIEQKLADPAVSADSDLLQSLSRERAKLAPVVELIEREAETKRQIEELATQLKIEKDTEILDILREEKEELDTVYIDVTQKLEYELLPKDPDSGKNVFVEIRAGTGGDEACLFVRDLYRMYTKFLERNSIPVDLISMTDTGLNGLKEVIFLVKGDKAYDYFHLEAGTHRVQRIPETESGGRIHTSAVTVAVIPEVEEAEFNINPSELRIDTFRSSGPGGQSVNTTDSAIRITHLPTGLIVSCQDEKSQHKNKAKALKVLSARLIQKQKEETDEKNAIEKRAQIGSGDRSEKIRTYNYPQSRVTDHRINYTSHNLDRIMEGELEDIFRAVLSAEREKQLSA
ncbi:MAG: peptide chain release factor 1 [Leptospirales bacterium]